MNEKGDFLFQELKDRVKLSRIRDHFICKFISILYNQLKRNVPALPPPPPSSLPVTSHEIKAWVDLLP